MARKIFYIGDMHLGDETHLPWNRLDGIEDEFGIVEDAYGVSDYAGDDVALDDYHAYTRYAWNHIVGEDDIVYIVGDLFSRYSDPKDYDFVGTLNGEKHLIIGNHDYAWILEPGALERCGIVECEYYAEIDDCGRTVCVNHVPIYSWSKKTYGSYHVYAHVHVSPEEDYFQSGGRKLVDDGLIPEFRAVNAGSMLNGYVPVTLDEMCRRYGIGKMGDEEFYELERMTKRHNQ